MRIFSNALRTTVLLLLGLNHLQTQGSAFTYQGRLSDGGGAANGMYDFRFALFDAVSTGTQIGSALTNSAVTVSNGIFSVSLDFGTGIFNGDARWLEIGVRTNGNIGFFTLSPRQPLNATPYALYAITPAGPQGPAGLTGPAGPQGPQGVQGVPGLTWRGAWSAGNSYAVNDAVQSGGSAWMAKTANTAILPAEGAD